MVPGIAATEDAGAVDAGVGTKLTLAPETGSTLLTEVEVLVLNGATCREEEVGPIGLIEIGVLVREDET